MRERLDMNLSNTEKRTRGIRLNTRRSPLSAGKNHIVPARLQGKRPVSACYRPCVSQRMLLTGNLILFAPQRLYIAADFATVQKTKLMKAVFSGAAG